MVDKGPQLSFLVEIISHCLTDMIALNPGTPGTTMTETVMRSELLQHDINILHKQAGVFSPISAPQLIQIATLRLMLLPGLLVPVKDEGELVADHGHEQDLQTA